MHTMQQLLRKRLVGGSLAVVTAVLLVAAGAALRGAVVDDPVQVNAQSAAALPHSVAAGRDSYADVVQLVAPAVVTVRVESTGKMSPTEFQGPPDDFFRRFFGQPFGETPQQQQPREFHQRGLGSGVIVTPDGYILTNFHVVGGADTVRVDLTDGRTFDADIKGTDQPTDLALIKIDAQNLPVLKLGDSDAVRVGDVVLAVGNPLGVGQTVTMGIISAKGRSTGGAGDGSYESFLQTDAPINQGNSGGALVNTKGELIGINSQILSTSTGNIGIGFSIPVNMAKSVMTQLREHGSVRRGQLGVTVQQMTSDLAKSLGLSEVKGAIVSSVTPDSAADHAGIERGDVITAFNGKPITNFNDLRNRVAEAGPSARSTVTVIRNGQERTFNVTLDEVSSEQSARNGSQPGGNSQTALGVSVQPLTPELADRAGVKPGTKGLLVQDVDPDGRAAEAGVQQGDVILEVNQQPVESADALRAALAKNADRPVLLLVSRDGQNLFLTARP
jgi:Do/DeqQ family serine protease